jgi:hypothetical protein
MSDKPGAGAPRKETGMLKANKATRLLPALAALVLALALTGTVMSARADAYLHVLNAQSACGNTYQVYANTWSLNNAYGTTTHYTTDPAYRRASDSDVTVQAAEWSLGVLVEVCRVVGSDASPGIYAPSSYTSYAGPRSPWGVGSIPGGWPLF